MSQRVLIVLVLVVCARCASGQSVSSTTPPSAASAQSTVPPNASTPAEAYKQSMHPLEQVRASLDNWSDAELGALAVGMHRASEACSQRKPEDYSGDDLYDLAHLCSFGQNWSGAYAAATRYIASHAEPHRAQAYATSVNALIRAGDTEKVIQTTREMLNSLPYSAEVAFTFRYVEDTLEQSGNGQALLLASDEHEKIIAALQQGTPLKAANGDAAMSIGALYESAMQLAFYEQYMNNGIAGVAIAASCDKALPDTATLTQEDAQRVDSVRTRYHLLGARLPNLTIMRALIASTAKPQLPQSFGAGTVLVLFPDWCTQCRHMMKTLTEFAKVNATTPLHAYGLVFADTAMVDDKATHDAWLKELQGTSTFIVPAETAQTFAAQEFPLAIVVDEAGAVRFIGTIPPTAFNGDGYIEKIIQRMVAGSLGKKPEDAQAPRQ